MSEIPAWPAALAPLLRQLRRGQKPAARAQFRTSAGPAKTRPSGTPHTVLTGKMRLGAAQIEQFRAFERLTAGQPFSLTLPGEPGPIIGMWDGAQQIDQQIEPPGPGEARLTIRVLRDHGGT